MFILHATSSARGTPVAVIPAKADCEGRDAESEHRRSRWPEARAAGSGLSIHFDLCAKSSMDSDFRRNDGCEGIAESDAPETWT
jgi:hypothetical protein